MESRKRLDLDHEDQADRSNADQVDRSPLILNKNAKINYDQDGVDQVDRSTTNFDVLDIDHESLDPETARLLRSGRGPYRILGVLRLWEIEKGRDPERFRLLSEDEL